ncbi:hypothetical protein F5X97DRAFT_322720 [Nemania serpens]|nr:hypothetical protein F5X97DRAFT_322720 [Nemania serpens]
MTFVYDDQDTSSVSVASVTTLPRHPQILCVIWIAQADSTGYFAGEPSCALPCLTSAITAAGCQLSDIACQCGPTQSVIANKIGGCILRSCTDPTALGDAINAGQAVCSSFLAGELSFTTPEGPAQTPTPTPVPGSSSGTGTTDTSIIMTNPPTPSSTSSGGGGGGGGGSGSETSTGSPFSSITPGGTHTDTLIGPSSPILTGSIISLPTSTPTGAAATPGRPGAGVLAGVVGAVALL